MLISQLTSLEGMCSVFSEPTEILIFLFFYLRYTSKKKFSCSVISGVIVVDGFMFPVAFTFGCKGSQALCMLSH
jgi:hypothetical protein